PDNSLTPSWSFTGEGGATFECRLTRGATVVSDWTSCTSPQGYDLTGQPDGTYTFAVRATDPAGNTGAPATSDYLLDTTPPTPRPSLLAALPTSPDNSLAPSWSFTGEGGATFECRLTRGATVVADWTPCTSPYAADLTGQPDGTYTFAVRATDPAGNTGA